MNNLELQIIQYITNAVRTLKAQPLQLAGRPGGFVGRLPQTQILFDPDERAIFTPYYSGVSLLDNLNNIRYRLAVTEMNTSWVLNEDLTSQIIPGNFYYDTAYPIASGTLCLYYNGLRETTEPILYSGGEMGFEVAFSVYSGDTMVVDYMQYVTFSGDYVTYDNMWGLDNWGGLW